MDPLERMLVYTREACVAKSVPAASWSGVGLLCRAALRPCSRAVPLALFRHSAVPLRPPGNLDKDTPVHRYFGPIRTQVCGRAPPPHELCLVCGLRAAGCGL
jgi:hypothetical protein